jgi:hypothetical protein
MEQRKHVLTKEYMVDHVEIGPKPLFLKWGLAVVTLFTLKWVSVYAKSVRLRKKWSDVGWGSLHLYRAQGS